MGANFYPGDDAQHHGLYPSLLSGDRIEPGELGRPVGHHRRDAGSDRKIELVVGLVTAVHHDPVCGRTGAQTGFQLAAAGGQQIQALLQHQPDHRVRGEGLDRVHNPREQRDRGPGPGSDLIGVEDQQRGAEACGQRRCGDPRYIQATGRKCCTRGPWPSRAQQTGDVPGDLGSCRALGRLTHRRAPSTREPTRPGGRVGWRSPAWLRSRAKVAIASVPGPR